MRTLRQRFGVLIGDTFRVTVCEVDKGIMIGMKWMFPTDFL